MKNKLVLLLMIGVLTGKGQEMPNVIPPSPEASAFLRYGEIPVDYSTGVPKIEIPIYTIEEGSLSVPISVSYHASGIKADDIASEVGLGWTLNVGGVLVKTILGEEDTDPSVYSPIFEDQQDAIDLLIGMDPSDPCVKICGCGSYNPFVRFEMANEIKEMINNSARNKSDRYYCSVPGFSAVFRNEFPYSSASVFHPVPYSPAIYDKPNERVITEDGTIYEFSPRRSSGDYTSDVHYLERIVSPNNIHSINYTYGGTETYSYEKFKRDASTGEVWMGWDDPAPTTRDEYPLTFNIFHGNTIVYDSIYGTRTTVKFVYNYDNSQHKKFTLGSIKIYNRFPRKLVKEIRFTQHYFNYNGSDPKNNFRLKLQKVSIYGENGAGPPMEYEITYNTNEGIPAPPVPNYDNFSHFCEDYWGYYNGSGSWDQFSVPKDFLPSDKKSLGRDRNVDTLKTQYCLIKKITYPTGGWTDFFFEQNRSENYVFAADIFATRTQIHKYLGGVRVKQIINNDGNGHTEIKTYAYSGAVHKTIKKDMIMFEQEHYRLWSFPTSTLHKYDWRDFTRKHYSDSPLEDFCLTPGNPVVYTHVEEYNGSLTDNIGRTIYTYEAPQLDEVYGFDNMNPENTNTLLAPRQKTMYHHDRGFYNSKLLTVEYQKKNGDGSFSTVKRISNTYANYHVNSFKTGVHVMQQINYENMCEISPVNTCAYGCDEVIPSIYNPYDYFMSFCVSNTYAHQDLSKLTQTIVIDQGVSTTTTYGYTNTTHMMPTIITTIGSKGENLITYYRYPVDASSIGGLTSPQIAACNTMVNRNQISPVIEERQYKEANKLSTKLTTYKDFGSAKIYPEFIKTSTGNDTPENRFEYISYDTYGNLTSAYKTGDIPTCYIWGYNNTLPVAKVVGATYSEVSSALGYSLFIINTGTYSDSQLRSYLSPLYTSNYTSGAHVYTYTYKPLVGITSETDPNGITTYYEYDSFGRLDRVLDQNLKEIKKYIYHYKE